MKLLCRKIRLIDVINCIVGVAMLFVAISAYRVASDTGDLKDTVKKLSMVAAQTTRQANAATNQLAEMQAENRAWIAPANPAFRDKLSRSKDLVARINFSNTGHQPAFDFSNSISTMQAGIPKTDSVADRIEWSQLPAWSDIALRFDHLCSGVHVRPGALVIFPSAASGIDSPAIRDPKAVAAIKRGQLLFGIVGCIAYTALGHERNSSFCYYLEPIPDVKLDDWDIKTCPTGNHAD
jgi:hypothetical protein